MLSTFFTAGLALTVTLASAYTQPTGDAPEGNPISEPGLSSVVPAGQPFTVTWEPTTKGTVSLVLLKGSSSNAVPQYAIAEKIPNSGSYSWTPSTDLAPGQTGYGIQLIDDATGAYQYTTQFGISNPDYEASTTTTSSASWSADSWSASSDSAWPTATWSSHPGAPAQNATWGTSNTSAWTTPTASPWAPVGTGSTSKPTNVTTTAPGAVSTTAKTTMATSTTAAASSTAASTSSAPVQTGAASSVATSFAGLVLAAGAAVLIL